jgi:hypothetical protein
MKTKLVALAVLVSIAGTAQAQSYAMPTAWPGSTAIYEPANGPLPLDRRYMMTREGVEAARYEQQNPRVVAQVQTAAQSAPQRNYYDLPQTPARAVVSAPEWFVNLPPDTADVVFAAGTATSTDEQMAYDKARMGAERKLVEMMYSRIQTQTKSYRADRGDASIENYEQITRKNARGELSGTQRVDSQATFDGRTYKVYVLLRLPMGNNNAMQAKRDQTRLQRETEIRSRAAERDMDKNETSERTEQRENDANLERNLSPQSKATNATVPTTGGDLKLLDVDNAEYKQRRAETLEKPGAVIGQTTMR